MKRNILLFSVIMFAAITACAKKVKVTIDGRTMPSQTTLYLIINEDTAHAVRVPIEDARYSITVKVDQDAFIRLHDRIDFSERCPFVLIPDSKHITVDWRTGTIEGSPMSQKLKELTQQIQGMGPGTFHIDVFSDNPEDWKRAREQERSIRAEMEKRQQETIVTVMQENADNIIPAWIFFCYGSMLQAPPTAFNGGTPPKWAGHPILKQK